MVTQLSKTITKCIWKKTVVGIYNACMCFMQSLTVCVCLVKNTTNKILHIADKFIRNVKSRICILKQTPNATRSLAFNFYKKIIFIKIVLPRTDEHDLLDENRKSCCTWSWLVLYGNHVCHSTVHWLSMIYFFKYQNLILKYAYKQMDVGRWDGCSVVGIFQSLSYQDCGRNITNNVRWWMCI